ncbi:hypothetical protein [Pseudomonas baetica]|jgi:hypothetical protein|uniref:hypothetical protein n=1 Tax=Pseudomonas baetica TaxID=674054 RepID=UPI0028711CD5|nr:hypothetical protein [Pseudomonas baetica]MDR9862898.1 hypothetical protein [Pseudomonas baetica]
MPISLKPFATKSCEFTEWSINASERERLVEVLAYLYLRQEENAIRVISALSPKTLTSRGKVADNVIRKLTAPLPQDVADLASPDVDIQKKAKDRIKTSIYHRDGLLFQHISWIVAKKASPHGVMTSPHVRNADKGFDGFVMELDQHQEAIETVILCEDKASEAPRNLVTQSVWPEIEAIINGQRDDEVLAELVTLLKSVPSVDAEDAIQTMFWEEARHFRVCVATSEKIRDEKLGNHTKVLAGFEKKVVGASKKRVGGVLVFGEVREGLAKLAMEVVEKVKELTDV